MLVEADFMQDIETDYHKTTLRLNREVIWWPITQVFVTVVTEALVDVTVSALSAH